jgi:hypothetical protein
MPKKKPLTELTGPKLTDRQKHWLDWLIAQGGSGVLDGYGRLQAGGETSPVGAMIAWLMLIQKGYVVGYAGRLHAINTEGGRTWISGAIANTLANAPESPHANSSWQQNESR